MGTRRVRVMECVRGEGGMRVLGMDGVLQWRYKTSLNSQTTTKPLWPQPSVNASQTETAEDPSYAFLGPQMGLTLSAQFPF